MEKESVKRTFDRLSAEGSPPGHVVAYTVVHNHFYVKLGMELSINGGIVDHLVWIEECDTGPITEFLPLNFREFPDLMLSYHSLLRKNTLKTFLSRIVQGYRLT